MIRKNKKDNFLHIKEFAELVDINPATLRHYDNIGLFKPEKHGRKHENNYRYYSPKQITSVKVVRILTEIGVPLDTIKSLVKSRIPEQLVKVLNKYKALMEEEIQTKEEIYSVINILIEQLYEGIGVMEKEIYVAKMPEKHLVLGGKNDFQREENFVHAFSHFCKEAHESKINLAYPIGGYFESMECFLNAPSQPTRFFSLDPKGHEKRDAGTYLVGYTRGNYGCTNDLPTQMEKFAQAHSLEFAGPVYNTYLFDELSVTNSDEYLLQVAAAITETRRIPSRHLHCDF